MRQALILLLLPALLMAAPLPSGAETRTQDEVSLRDPFDPVPALSSGSPERIPLRVTGLVQSGNEVYAMVWIDGETRVLHVGDRVRGARVVSITPDSLKLGTEGRRRTMRVGERTWALEVRYGWEYCLEPDHPR